MRSLGYAASLSLLTVLTACGGGGGGGGTPPIGNLRATTLRTVSQNPNAAHEMELATGIEASRDYEQVSVSYVLLNRADVDSQATEVRQREISTAVFENVRAGESEYTAVVSIPTEVREAADWYLLAQVDAADAITETDEDDNLPADDQKIEVTIGSANTDLADVVIESAEVEQDAVVLEPEAPLRPMVTFSGMSTNDVSDHDFGTTLVMTTTGSQELVNVDLSASISSPGIGSDLPLRLWDEDRGQYRDEVFNTITPGVPNTVHADVRIPGNGSNSTRERIRDHLLGGGDNLFQVTFSNNMTAGFGEWENGVQRHTSRSSDNRITVDVVIVLPGDLPNPCNDIAWQAGYKKDWANKVFSLGVDFGATASLDSRGAIGEAHAAVPVRLFGLSSNAVDFRTMGRILPQETGPADAEFSLDYSMFGVSLYTTATTDPSYTFDNTESQTKTYEQRGTLFVGPVPISLRAKATATLGYRTQAYLGQARVPAPALAEVEVIGTAFGSVRAFAEASVNAIVIRAGVAGTVNLLDDEFVVRGHGVLEAPQNGEMTGRLTMEAVNELTGPNGRIYLFEEHKVPKWCWEVVPCGFRTVRNEKTIVRFRTFRKRDVLFSDTRTETVCL